MKKTPVNKLNNRAENQLVIRKEIKKADNIISKI